MKHIAAVKVRVLLVEDNPGDAFLIQEYLEDDHDCQYDIDHVFQLSEAFHALDESHYDIVLLDLSLPDSSGIDTVTRLEASPNLHSPVIVLTGMQNEQIAMQAIHENAQDYMVKTGLDEGALYRAIRYAIERYGLYQDMQQIIQINPNGMVVVNYDDQQTLFSNRAAEEILARTPGGRLIDLLDIPSQLNKAEDTTIASDLYLRISCFEIKWQSKQAYLVKLIDITQDHLLHERLNHARRLESLGILAGGIAHDFNNLLTAIMGNAALARKQAQAHPEMAKYLQRIEGSSQKAADICQQMLAYSGKSKFVVGPVQLTDIVSEILDLLQVSIAKNIELNTNLSQNNIFIEADTAQLQQVIMNLVINANEAIGDDIGSISISTGVMQANVGFLSQSWVNETLPAGRYAFLKVGDTGCGIDEKTMEKIFDPFFTTKITGRGLGMSSVLGIIRGHGGCIFVDSEPGKGTSFTVLFPIIESIHSHRSLGRDDGKKMAY